MMLNLILIVAVIALVYHFISTSGKMMISLKATHWILFGYIGLLLVAAVIVPFLNVKTYGVKDSGNVEFIFDKLALGDLSGIPEENLTETKTIKDYPHETVTIQSPQEGAFIFIERTAGTSKNIEAYSYRGTIIVDGNDFSQLLKPVSLKVKDDTIAISDPSQEINISLVTKNFPEVQFTQKTPTNEPFDNYLSSGLFINDYSFYLKIPSSIEVIASESSQIVHVEK
jgi:hypothetical protein